jgi:sugar lactone lactonase YvrE
MSPLLEICHKLVTTPVRLLARTTLALALNSIPGLAQSTYTPYTFVTFAGGRGSADGTGNSARFSFPTGVAVDGAGNIYVADMWNDTIRKATPGGDVTTLAGLAGSTGSSDGIGSNARFYSPQGVAVDGAGNLYVADMWNSTIRKVTPHGVVTTLAGSAGSMGSEDGVGIAARFKHPTGLAVDSSGNVYVADSENNSIRKVTPDGVVTTVAGVAGSYGSADGTMSVARFSYPRGVAVDDAGNVYVADANNFTIRKVAPGGVVTTVAGLPGSPGSADGTGSAARFGLIAGGLFGNIPEGPTGVAVDGAGNLYVADSGNDAIRKVTPKGEVTTLAGLAGFDGIGSSDGTGSAARFNSPQGVAVDGVGNVYVADTNNSLIRKGNPVPMILSSRLGINGGQFNFFLTGPAGQSVVVEASTDLVSWLPIWTNTFAGALNFSDPESGVYANRFYRAHAP